MLNIDAYVSEQILVSFNSSFLLLELNRIGLCFLERAAWPGPMDRFAKFSALPDWTEIIENDCLFILYINYVFISFILLVYVHWLWRR